ncbi:hypothetical protein [Calderihabitans maritimus]|uniref:Uncharacterized protein n=1 Tax=Calderihabitans maritimus TaxID=1246530 RepID=A0A1Z5HPT5_9FIRM|nr:hypothetical protein [Calderihabitans maritimus]GAW91542.1 hypothetical protein Moth_1076 [Calderihabitans maritimus]
MLVHGLKIPVIILTAILTFGLLLGGQWLYTHYQVEQPLAAQLERVNGVDDYYIQKKNAKLLVSVSLAPVNNLMHTYREIEQAVREVFPGKSIELIVKDRRNKLLERAWYESQFAVHQAVAQGSYVEMARVIEEVSNKYNIERYAVNIDQDNIYVQFHKDEVYLYEIVSRRRPIPEKLLGYR